MSKIALTLLLFIGLVSSAIGQTAEIDSLRQELFKAKDTTRVMIYRQLGFKFRRINMDSAKVAFTKGFSLAREIKFYKGEVTCLYGLGSTYGMAGDYPEALTYLNRSLNSAILSANVEGICNAYNALGIVYKRIGDYPTSKSYYLKNLQIADSLGLGENKANTLSNLGILYDLTNEPDKALEAYQTALEVYDGDNYEDFKSNIDSNIAVLYFNEGNYEKAIETLNQVLENAQKRGNLIDESNAHSNLGISHTHLQNWTLALRHLMRAKVIAEELSLKQEYATALRNLAELYLKQDKHQEAKAYSDQNLEAIKAFENFHYHKEGHEIAYQIAKKSNRLNDAIYHLEQVMVYKDSLLNETKIREIESLEIRHNVDAKDREIKAQDLELALLNAQVELESKRNVYLAIIAFLLLAVAGLFYFRFRNKRRSNELLRQKNSKIEEQKREIEVINAELEKRMLRAQMNPHFIFNSLNSIQHFITTNDKVSALTYLTKFSSLLRQVLESSINLNLILDEEIKLLKIYVELEALRFDESFQFEFDIDPELDTFNYEIPVLLVQPFLENAILHGLIPKQGEKRLTIRFEDSDKFILCSIIDNGVGRAASGKKESNRPSRGMSVTAQRISSLNQNLNEELLTIEDLSENNQPAGTRVTIKIPKN